MYRLFVGDFSEGAGDHQRVPADLRMKINLLPYLHKLNTYCWPECIQVSQIEICCCLGYLGGPHFVSKMYSGLVGVKKVVCARDCTLFQKSSKHEIRFLPVYF